MKKEKNKLLNYKELLIDVLSVQTSSGQEDLMIEYIDKFVKKHIPEADIVIKDNKNLIPNKKIKK